MVFRGAICQIKYFILKRIQLNKKVIIIGSGVAGLALSVRLKSKGYDVEVFEKNKNVGGKLSDFYLNNFRHDFGPKLFTMPNLIEDIFEDAKVDIDKYFKYSKLDLACKYFWDDGHIFNAYSDSQKFINEVHKKFDKEGNKVEEYIFNSKKKFKIKLLKEKILNTGMEKLLRWQFHFYQVRAP